LIFNRADFIFGRANFPLRREEITMPHVLATFGRRASTILLLSTLAGSMAASASFAQTPEVDALKDAAAQAADFLSSVHSHLLPYDRVLQMQVARGALSNEQAAAQLQQRADDLAKGAVTADAQVEEERQEANAYFDAIEQAATNAPHWPDRQSPDYYQALVSIILERSRADYATQVAEGKDPSAALDDSYRALALTRGEENPSASPFSNSNQRVFAAADVPEAAAAMSPVAEPSPQQLPPPPPPPSEADLPGSLEFGVNRPGQDMASFDLDEGDTPADCASLCEQSSDCRAFTFVQPGIQAAKPRCWLKNAVPEPQESACCVSGVKRASE
jgi:PAN domain